MPQSSNAQWQRRGIREPSFEVKPEWEVIQEFSQQRFQKLPGFEPADLGVKATLGRIYQFENNWNKARAQKPIKIPHFDGELLSEDLFDDPIFERFAKEGIAQVFMTDVAAAAIMCASKAVFSWDLVLKKVQNFIFIQKRDEENILDWQTVAETAQQDFQPLDIDGPNGVRFIMKEAATTQVDF